MTYAEFLAMTEAAPVDLKVLGALLKDAQYDRVEYSAPIGSTIDREVFARKICQELGIEELTITQEYVLRGKQ